MTGVATSLSRGGEGQGVAGMMTQELQRQSGLESHAVNLSLG